MSVKRWFPKRAAPTDLFGAVRNIGLVLFFAGTGVPAGMQITAGIEMRIFFYGALMTVLPIAAG